MHARRLLSGALWLLSGCVADCVSRYVVLCIEPTRLLVSTLWAYVADAFAPGGAAPAV